MNRFIDKYGVRFVYILVFAIILVFFLWATFDYQKTLQNNLLSESRLIVRQMLATKAYIDQEQNAINADSQGGYEFKGVYADKAVRKMGEILAGTATFTVRQVSLNPRNDENAPDRFEKEMLKEFEKDPGILERYKSGSIGGQKVFRYIVPLRIIKPCIPCHGSKKGDVDITGHKKEGYEIGDLAGGMSVIIKYYKKFQLLRNNMSILLLFVFFLTFSIALVINNMNNHFKEKLSEAHSIVKDLPAVTVGSDTYNAKLDEKFRKLMMHNLRNPIGEVIDSAEMFKDVPLNILEESYSASSKISSFTSKLIELKKLELGQGEILLSTFDFVSAIRPRFSAYDNTARKKSVRLEAKSLSKPVSISTDKNILLKAIDNLFMGILRFTKKESGRINIVLDIDPSIGSLVISFSNNASRIGPDSEDLIFEKFTDIKDANGHFLLNTGVELTLSKFIMGRLGYGLKLNADNKYRNEFIITIPTVVKSDGSV